MVREAEVGQQAPQMGGDRGPMVFPAAAWPPPLCSEGVPVKGWARPTGPTCPLGSQTPTEAFLAAVTVPHVLPDAY